MAKSSFEYFRKHTKVAVVLLGTLCILAFVVADPLMQYLSDSQGGGGRSRRADEAVSWQGGELSEGQLGSLVSRRRVLAGFLQRVEQEGAYAAMQAGVPSDVPLRVDRLSLPVQYEQGVEQDVLRTQVFAQAARKAGMVVDDQTIVEYLKALGRDYVTRDQMRLMISGIQVGNGRATPEFMFDLIREAMLARDYVGSFAYTRATVMPQQRWEDWLKVNDRVVVETAALPVEEFLGEVKEPTEAQLTAFYNEYKERVPGPEMVANTALPSPTPGFRTPNKAKLQFVKADFPAATQEALKEVTDEEVAKYYQENKEMFVKADSDLAADEDDVSAVVEEPAVEPADEPADESQEDAEEKETDPAPAADEPAQPATEQSGEISRKSPFRLAAFQADEPAKDSGETEEAAAGEEPKGSALDEFMKPGEDEEAEADDSAADSTGDASSDAAQPEGAGADKGPKPEKPVEYQPLEEVKEDIREALARDKAMEDLRKRMNDLKGLLKKDYDAYFNRRIDAETSGKPTPEPPESLVDWQKLAADNGMEFGDTELASIVELSEQPTGKLIQPDEQLGVTVPIYYQAFRTDGMDLYEPVVAYDTDRNHYLVMKVAVEKQSTPKLEEIRDQVVAAWKKEQAAKLALARAKELAKKAADSGVSLKEEFAGDKQVKVDESEMFSWLTPVPVSRTGAWELRLDDPGTVQAAGPEFMETVFKLGPNEAAAAMNHDDTMAYVVRVAQRESSQAELRQDFLREWDRWPGLAGQERQYLTEAAQAIFLNLVGGEEPDWKRPPDQAPVERDSEEA